MEAARIGRRNSSVMAATAAGPASAAPVVLPRRLRDQLTPRSDEAMRQRVAGELERRGGFQPLMHLFPIPQELISNSSSVPAGATPSGSEVVGDVIRLPTPPQSRGQVQTQPGLAVSTSANGHADTAGESTALSPLDVLLRTPPASAGAAETIPWTQRDVALRRLVGTVPLGSAA